MQIKLEFGVIFFELKLAKARVPGRKHLGVRKRVNLDSGTAVKCTVFGVVGFSIGLMQKVLVISVYSPENEVCPFSHILCKP